MNISEKDTLVYSDNENRKEYFYKLCKNKNTGSKLKKFFSFLKEEKIFDNQLLTLGLFGAIFSEKEQLIKEILEFAKENNVAFFKHQYQPLFNCACSTNNTNIIDCLDERFSIIKSSLNQDGKIEVKKSGKHPASENSRIYSVNNENRLMRLTSYFHYNTFKFNVFNGNERAIDYLLSKNENHINPTLIKEVFIDSCIEKRSEAILYLATNELTKKVIKESEIISIFLNEPTQFVAIKKEAKSTLAMIELSEALNDRCENKNRNINKI